MLLPRRVSSRPWSGAAAVEFGVLNLSAEGRRLWTRGCGPRASLGIGMSPEQMAAEYSTALRITPTRVRVY